MATSRTQSGVPVVSILMATYNFERFVARAIESALAQDYPADALDIVVIDDGSTDSTPSVVEPYLDHIRYIRKPNGGLLTTINRGFAEARGKYVSLLSGDDEFMPHKTRVQVDLLESRSEVGLVYADLEVVDDDGNTLQPSLWQSAQIAPVRGPNALGPLLRRNVISGGALMMRAELLDELAPIPDTTAWEDWYLAAKVAERSELEYLDQTVYRYRYHGQNMNLGATGAKLVGLLRSEIPFRRLLLAEVRPGSVSAEDLMAGWATFTASVSQVAQHDGKPPERMLEVSDEQRARSLAGLAAGREALAKLDPERALFAFVSAMAEDPWNTDAKDQAEAALALASSAAAAAEATAVPGALRDARSVRVLAFADELISVPGLLGAYAAHVGDDDDVTLVIVGHGEDFGALGGAVAAAGLDGDGSPDMLAVPIVDASPERLALHAVALYSCRGQDDSSALGSLRRIDDAHAEDLEALSPPSGPRPG